MNHRNHARTLAARLFAAALLLVGAGSALAATIHYVDVNSTYATPPFTNWTTAATNIQDAVDAAVAGDEIVVTNGTYYPMVVDKALSLRSVNGAQFATIDGHGSARCVSLNDSASLSSFTLTNGFLNGYSYGAGVSGQSNAVVSDCVITGGAYGVTLNNCSLTS